MRENARAQTKGEVAVSTTFSTEDRLSALKGKSLWERPQVGKNRGFTRRYFRVTRLKSVARRSDGPRATKESDRKHEERTKEAENPMNGDSYKPKRQCQEPY